MFYSISNCQKGLRGISFGSFLIKQVVEELSREFPGLKRFVTLSPVPSLRRWAQEQAALGDDSRFDDSAKALIPALERGDTLDDSQNQHLRRLAAFYLLKALRSNNQILAPVARISAKAWSRLSCPNALPRNTMGKVQKNVRRQAYTDSFTA